MSGGLHKHTVRGEYLTYGCSQESYHIPSHPHHNITSLQCSTLSVAGHVMQKGRCCKSLFLCTVTHSSKALTIIYDWLYKQGFTAPTPWFAPNLTNPPPGLHRIKLHGLLFGADYFCPTPYIYIYTETHPLLQIWR